MIRICVRKEPEMTNLLTYIVIIMRLADYIATPAIVILILRKSILGRREQSPNPFNNRLTLNLLFTLI